MTLALGRRPPKNAPALRLAPLLTGAVPTHPAAVDYLARLSGWKMLGNDQYGDCVAVTWANARRLVTASLATEHYPTLTQVLALYKTQNPAFPAQDDGMDMQTCLEYLATTGGPDGVKAIAFAKVDHTNRAEVEAATAIFGGLWTGITVIAANQAEFDAGQPWDFVAGSPIEGGHCVLSGGYTGQAANDERFITWAAETGFTDAFWDKLTDELWVVIWPEHFGSTAFLQGVNLGQLAADYAAITGRALPVPAVVPTPPAADPNDVALANAVRAWASARHSGTNAAAAQAVRVWLAAKGLA